MKPVQYKIPNSLGLVCQERAEAAALAAKQEKAVAEAEACQIHLIEFLFQELEGVKSNVSTYIRTS